jgi:hypothetical protein
MTGRRRDPRRHTLQNGIDYNMVYRSNITDSIEASCLGSGALTLTHLYVYGTRYHYATSWKVTDSRPSEVIEFFSLYLLLPAALGRGGLPSF